MSLKITTGITVSAIRLYYFSEVIATGSMRAASEKLGVAPSSVSRQVAQLEKELGVALLEKGRRKILPTEAGSIAMKYFRHHLSEEEAFVSELEDIRGLRKGNVNLALGEGFVGDSLSTILSQFSDQNPDMQINILVGSTSRVLQSVYDDESHLGMVLDVPVDPRIRVRKSILQPIRAIVSAEHPWAEKRAVTMGELALQRLALPQKGFRIRQLVSLAERFEGIFLKPTITSNSLLILKNFAKSGKGVTLLPDIALMAEHETGSLRSISVHNKALKETQIQIILRVRRELPPGAIRLLELLEGYLQSAKLIS